MLLIKGHLDTPGKGGTGHAEILQACLQEVVDDLLLAGLGLNEAGMLLDVGHESVGVLLHVEEIGLLRSALDLAATVGALAISGLGVGEEGLAGDAVPALVAALIDIALIVELLEQLLHSRLVVVVGGADEVIVGNVHLVPQILDLPRHAIHVGLGGDARGVGEILDLLAVLVGTRAEVDVVAHLSLVAGDGVGHDGLVGVAEVGLLGGVGDGGGDVILGLLIHDGLLSDTISYG